MIEKFSIKEEVFQDTAHASLHFKLTLDGKEYEGQFKEGDVNWFQMQPNPDNHEISMEELDSEVRRRIAQLIGTPSE